MGDGDGVLSLCKIQHLQAGVVLAFCDVLQMCGQFLFVKPIHKLRPIIHSRAKPALNAHEDTKEALSI